MTHFEQVHALAQAKRKRSRLERLEWLAREDEELRTIDRELDDPKDRDYRKAQ